MMKFSRIRIAFMAAAGAIAPLLFLGTAAASNDYEALWQGDVSTEWNTASNWYVEPAPGDHGFVPQSSSGFDMRAIIGTDDPNGVLNTRAGNSPVISAALPAAKQTIGGLYLGARQLDYTLNPPPFVQTTAPDVGALVGALTISAGTLNNISTGHASFGSDGRIMVGVDGRGFLTMTGGTLTGPSITVDGEDIESLGDSYTNDTYGNSMLDLSGSATLTIGTSANLNRRLRITGPDVTFTTGGSTTFGSSGTFSAVITSASGVATHAMIQPTGAARLGGALNVEFSGVSPSVGDTWNLIDSATGIAGNFNNLGFGGQIVPTGVPAAPTGSAYYVRQVSGGAGKLVQLSYDGVLVLHVNRTTGELTISNPFSGDIDIDAYSVRSALGSMVNTYDGITTDSGWEKPLDGMGQPLNSVNSLTETKQVGSYDVTGIGSSGISLGNGFYRQGVAADVNNFGTDGEDLIFEYRGPGTILTRGQVVYEGTKFENNLVLRVNPNTGEATLKNDSLETLTFDGYTLLSSTGAFGGTGWSGLGGDWDQTTPTANALTETNLLGSTTLMPNQEVSIGDLTTGDFTAQADQDGLSMQFILSESILSGGVVEGDYNENGVVDAADYTTWRDALTAGATELPNDSTPGVVDESDFVFWRDNFGSTGGPVEETEFRIGSVVFDDTLGAGSGAGSAAVPEPGTNLLLLIGLGTMLWVGRRRIGRRLAGTLMVQGLSEQLGGIYMSRQFGRCAVALLAICAAAMMVAPAQATTQGIPLTNGDFELPGPVGTKTIAFDETGAPLNNIPGWTFPGPGVEDFGHPDHENGDALGDSGTEGGGNPGNEMILSMKDGIAYQTSSFNAVSIPSTQRYRLSFDAHNIFTILGDGHPDYTDPQTQLTARLYYLAVDNTTRTTISTPLVIDNVGDFTNYTIDVVGGSGDLTPALGRPLGMEFDTTSDVYNPTWVTNSWIGIDNVLLQIEGVTTGDFDGDGDVDLIDYATVRESQQQTQLYNFQGEMTGDAFVDLNDFRAFKTAYEAANGGSGSLAAALAAQASVPEPSTFVLTLLLLAAVVCFKRGWLASRARLAVLAAIGLVVSAAPASAELFFYDPFLIGSNPSAGEYVVDTPLAGQNPTLPGTGYGSQPDFLSGAWRLVTGGGSNQGYVNDVPGMNYIGAPAEGGSIGSRENATTFSVDTRVGRFFKPGSEWTDATSGTYYISWLQNFGTITNPTDNMGFKAFEIWNYDAVAANNIGDDWLVADVGYDAYYGSAAQTNPATARLAAFSGVFNQGTPETFGTILEGAPDSYLMDGGTHLIVVKFEFSTDAASDSISLYLDPLNATEPDLAAASLTGQDITVAAIGMGQFGGNGPTNNQVDEIRIGTTFADVLPSLPYPGDTDGDGDVDLDDYNNIVTHMNLQVGSALEGDVAKADGTQGSDGRVTIADFGIWKDHYPYTPPGAGAGAGTLVSRGTIPEPASWLLMLFAALVAAIRGRRKS